MPSANPPIRETSPPPAARIPSTAPAGFVVFSACWAVYTLIHQLLTYGPWFRFEDPFELWINLAVVFGALAVLMKPGSVLRLGVMCGLAFALKAVHMPFLGNHLFFTMVINLVIVLALVVRWLSPVPGKHPAAAAYDTFAPTLRASVLVLYFWVVVHKLNWDYLNPQVSCGFDLYVTMGEVTKSRVGFALVPVADWMAYPCLLGALAFEAIIPLLLLQRRTRKLGLVVGVLFHLGLTLHSNIYIASFSAMLYALYTLFLPVDIRVGWVEAWRQSRLGSRVIKQPWLVAAAGAGLFTLSSAVVLALSLIGGQMDKQGVIENLHRVYPFVTLLLWFTWAFICLGVLTRATRRPWQWDDTDRRQYLPAQVAFAAFPVLLLLNGLSPYVGLKTHHAFAMFSNLRTEAHQSNHLLLPATLRVVDWVDDEVQVLATEPGGIRVNAPGERYTWFEFRRMMMDVGDGVAITYRRGDADPVTVTRAANPDDPAFTPPSYAWRKLFLLKEIPSDTDPCPCRH